MTDSNPVPQAEAPEQVNRPLSYTLMVCFSLLPVQCPWMRAFPIVTVLWDPGTEAHDPPEPGDQGTSPLWTVWTLGQQWEPIGPKHMHQLSQGMTLFSICYGRLIPGNMP